jgi:hypothetical protein
MIGETLPTRVASDGVEADNDAEALEKVAL